MKKLLFFSVVLMQNILSVAPSSAEKQQLLIKMAQYQGPKTYLLSYPRAANTWMRYCIEYTTHRPSFQPANYQDPRNQPLGWVAGFEVDCTKPAIRKTHSPNPLDKNDQLIVLVRNPKENIQRQEGSLSKDIFKTRARSYFDNIAVYDSWNPKNRILIYYEDFIADPKTTLLRVLNFLGESPERLNEFLADYELHQKKALELYKESFSKATDLLFHSRKLPSELRKQADEWIKELYPMQWNRYLKDRFSEEVLDYNAGILESRAQFFFRCQECLINAEKDEFMLS